MTQMALANKLGIVLSCVGKLESRYTPSVTFHSLWRVADALGYDLDFTLRRRDAKKPDILP